MTEVNNNRDCTDRFMVVEDEILGQAWPLQCRKKLSFIENVQLRSYRPYSMHPALAETDVSPSFHTVPFECGPLHS